MQSKKMDKQKDKLDKSFWNSKWENQKTGWDIGRPSPPIVEYMNRYPNKNVSILIPGCGNAYEAEHLVSAGFKDITLLDIAPKAVEIISEKFNEMPEVKVFLEDFFLFEGHYDLIIEQTFFCAHAPFRREEYAKKAYDLLKPAGRIVGVLFSSEFEFEGPPFGGTEVEYRRIFEPYFEIRIMEECYNSIRPRAGNELFIELIKR